MSVLFHPLRVSHLEQDASDALVVGFALPAHLREVFGFIQGQYLTLRTTLGGQEVRRSYSICAGVDDEQLRVAVRRVEQGVFSNWIHQSLEVGDTLEVMAPQGRFYVPLDASARRHHLGIAGGSGITPILSIMKTVLAREPHSRFTLIYSNRRPASAMFKEEIEDLKNRYMTRLVLHHVFTQEHVDAPIYNGRLDAGKLSHFLTTVVPAAGIDHAYICGPFEMNDEAQAALLTGGVPGERIHIERFGVVNTANPANPNNPDKAHDAVSHQARAGDAESSRILIIRDGLRREVVFHKDQPSLLDCASAAGLEMPYSCTSGVCGTCRAKVLEGQVRMERNFALEKSEVAAGYILTCQAHPLTERVVVSFDDR